MWHTTQRLSTFLLFNWLQVWLLYCPHLLLATGVSKSHAWKAIISYNFDKVPIILSSPILSYMWNFIKFDFSSLFLCFCSANKNNKHANTKTFAIGTLFWDNFIKNLREYIKNLFHVPVHKLQNPRIGNNGTVNIGTVNIHNTTAKTRFFFFFFF